MIRRHTRSLVVVLTVAVMGCAPVAEPSRSPDAGPAGSPNPGPLIVADVLTFKGGNDRTGRMPGPGPAREPVVLWELETNAGLLAGPLVAGGIVVAATEDGTVLGIEAATGRKAWELSLPAGVVATPTIADGTLYVLTLDGVLRTVSLSDRSLGWTAEGFIPESIITVVGDVALVGAPGALVAVSLADGSEAWRVAAPGSDRAATDGTFVYTGGASSGDLTAVRLADRSVAWTARTSAARMLTPAAVGDQVFAATRDVPGRENVLLRLGLDGNQVWRSEPDENHEIGGHAVLDGRIFASLELPAPAVMALDAASGERVWQTDLGMDMTAFPMVTREHVYVASLPDGVVALDPATGDTAWDVAIGDALEVEIAVTGGLVIATLGDRAGTGRVLALADPGDPRVAALASSALATPVPTGGPPPYDVLEVTPIEGQSLLLGLTVGPDGTMYAADMWNWRILVREPDGTLDGWGEPGSGPGQFDFSVVSENDTSTSVAISPDGELIAVGDGGNHRVQLFDRERTWLRSIGRLGREDGQFINPCCVTVDGDHNVWVVDTARGIVQVFSEEGDHIRTFGEPGAGDGQLRRPASAFVDLEANEVLIPDFGNRRVTVFSTKGTWLRHIGLPADAGAILDEVNAVARDRFGRTYILDTSSRIFVLDESGDLVGTIPNEHPELGFIEPSPFVVGEDGRLYLADIGGTTAGRLLILQLLAPLWPE